MNANLLQKSWQTFLEMSETEINNIFQSNTRHTSLDAPVHEAEDVAMGDLLEGSDDTG
jgi:RNA polymerase primary sigma factor